MAWYADRERHKATGRGGARRRAPNRAETYLKLSDEAVLIAGACRIRLGMTWVLLGRLLGVHESTICVFANNAVSVLEKHGITPDGRPRVRTMDQLREHAQAARIGTEVFDNLPEQEKTRNAAPEKRDTPKVKTRRRLSGAF